MEEPAGPTPQGPRARREHSSGKTRDWPRSAESVAAAVTDPGSPARFREHRADRARPPHPHTPVAFREHGVEVRDGRMEDRQQETNNMKVGGAQQHS